MEGKTLLEKAKLVQETKQRGAVNIDDRQVVELIVGYLSGSVTNSQVCQVLFGTTKNRQYNLFYTVARVIKNSVKKGEIIITLK